VGACLPPPRPPSASPPPPLSVPACPLPQTLRTTCTQLEIKNSKLTYKLAQKEQAGSRGGPSEEGADPLGGTLAGAEGLVRHDLAPSALHVWPHV
jgi:hypothetical protein